MTFEKWFDKLPDKLHYSEREKANMRCTWIAAQIKYPKEIKVADELPEDLSVLYKKKIEAFFIELSDDDDVTVVSVKLDWIEHFAFGKHDKYFLTNSDIEIKLK